jgi:hypothetical protein
MKAAFHYVVKAKLIRFKENNEIDFSEFEEMFENEEPIFAREEAFKRYQSIIDVLLESKNKKYTNDRDARIELKSFYSYETIINIGDQEVNFGGNYDLGIGIFMIINQRVTEIVHFGECPYIHGIMDSEYTNPDSQILMLSNEYEYYKHYNYDTKDYQTQILFCSETMSNLETGEMDIWYFDILKTPFDWEGYDKPYWWGEPEPEQIPETIEDLIVKGETNQVEFKPALLFNFKTKNAGIGVKGFIAKTICAFLNSNGGFLLIGVNDAGKIQGLENDFKLAGDKNPKDYFRLEFDQMLEHFLSFSVKGNVEGKFYEVDGKEIFVVTVSPNKRRPIFLKGQEGKEFYVRGEASSRKLTDIEEIANYCIDRFNV